MQTSTTSTTNGLSSSPGDTFPSLTSRNKSSPTWNGLNVFKTAAYESAGPLLLLAICSIASRFIWPSATFPLFLIASSLLATKIVVMLSDQQFPEIPMKVIREQTYLLNQKYPRLKIIGIVFSLALNYLATTLATSSVSTYAIGSSLCYLARSLSLTSAIGTGMYMAVLLSIKLGTQKKHTATDSVTTLNEVL